MKHEYCAPAFALEMSNDNIQPTERGIDVSLDSKGLRQSSAIFETSGVSAAQFSSSLDDQPKMRPIEIRTSSATASIWRTAVSSVMLLFAQAAQAQMPDVAAGKKRAEVCMACHGENGHAVMPGVPHLAGQNRDYLAQALKDYRLAQERHNPTMTEMAKPLSDTDIDNIAGFFHGLRDAK